MGLHIRGALVCLCGSLFLHGLLMWVCIDTQEPLETRVIRNPTFQVQLLAPQLAPILEVQPENVSLLNGVGDSANEVKYTEKNSVGAVRKSNLQEDIYVSEDKLEQRPYPLVPVIVPYPETVPGIHRGSVTLHLFIDSNGVVERGEVVRSDLLPDFGRSALNAFQNARMHPGIKDGALTKTKLVVWVEFDSEQ